MAKAQRTSASRPTKDLQTAFREVADALAERGTIDEQLAAQQSLAAAADELSYLPARYERGSDTYLNVLIAQRTSTPRARHLCRPNSPSRPTW